MNIKTTKIISTFGILVALGVLGLGLYSVWNNKDQVIPQIKDTLQGLNILKSDSKFNDLHTEALKASSTYYQVGANWHVQFVGTDDPDELGQVLVESGDQSSLVSKSSEGIAFLENKNPKTNFARVFVENLDFISVSGPSNVFVKDLQVKKLSIKANSQGSIMVTDSEIAELSLGGELKGDVQVTDSKVPSIALGLSIVGKIQLPKSLLSLTGKLGGTGSLEIESGYDKVALKNTLDLTKFVGELK